MSSGLILAPFLLNSLLIFASSLSSFDLSMTGTPSTTRMLSKPSWISTLYLNQNIVNEQASVEKRHELRLNV